MMRATIVISLLLILVCSNAASSQVRLPRLIRDSMVLQRNAEVKVWGWASIGEKITISFAGKKYNTTTNNNGKWLVSIPTGKAGGPYTMQVEGTNKIVITNILLGDVWLCSGQSNMQHKLELHKETYADEIATASNPLIRQFLVPLNADLQKPNEDLKTGYWKAVNPADVLQFSAVAYFFAKTIHDKYKVPIGIINATYGGTPIEAWTSEDGLKEFPLVINTINKNRDTGYINTINRAAARSELNKPRVEDNGLNEQVKWFDTSYKPKGWNNITIPGYWEDQGIRNLDGIVWYRKEIEVPAAMIGAPAKLFMGRIVDADEVYINGKSVGITYYQYPQRRYVIPAGILKAGKNTIVTRVTNYSGKGGFVPDKPYHITAGGQTIDLKGEWQFKVGAAFIPQYNLVSPVATQNQPTALFNAMIAPITNYAIKGMLWYQGESNISNASEYEKLLQALIKDWRKQWKQDKLPFVYVQLPNYDDVQYLPTESPWAVLREAQRKTLSLTNTAMAVTIDLGEWNDIHPDNKKDVGIRLALAAQKAAYKETAKVHAGPLFQSARIDSNNIIITFNNTGSGLITNDNEEPAYFAIAGADKNYVWAKAKIEGNTVVLSKENIQQPMYIRYAWADNPRGANLYNKEGLPASPFEAVITKE